MTRCTSGAVSNSCSRRPRSVCRLNMRRPPVPVGTASTIRTRARSAPAAIRRGTMVSDASSSALSRTTPPHGATPSPQGQRPPVVTPAARNAVNWLLPSPGSPTTSVYFPLAIRPGQSHSIGCGTISQARRLSRARARLSPAGREVQVSGRARPILHPRLRSVVRGLTERAPLSWRHRAGPSVCPARPRPAPGQVRQDQRPR